MAQQSVYSGGISIDPIIGLPPTGYISDDLKLNSMPVAEITPCKPEFRPGLSIFTLKNDWDTYSNQLMKVGYQLTKTPLKVAFLADNFPTDTFNNEYGESFLQKMTDVASGGMASISQFFGTKKLSDLSREVISTMKGQEGLVGTLGAGMEAAQNQLRSFGTSMKNIGGPIGTMAARVGSVANTLLSGARVDFPQVWKNSAYAPSYTMTVRLYNPNPGSLFDTKKHIIGPIAALLLLGLPQSEDGETYIWPFFSKVKAPGIYDLNPSYISSIAVIKGGDQQQIAYNQRLGIVDVRIDFGSLYNSIIVGGKHGTDRPTLKMYLQAMEKEKTITSAKDLAKKPNTVVIHEEGELGKKALQKENARKLALYKRSRLEDEIKARANSGHTQYAGSGEITTPQSRATVAQVEKYTNLYNQLPVDFYAA
jgi:hypothetical protein